MTFAFRADYARQVKIGIYIRRGEDGALAFELKKFGKISFLYYRKARPVTEYGTLNEGPCFRVYGIGLRFREKVSPVFYIQLITTWIPPQKNNVSPILIDT